MSCNDIESEDAFEIAQPRLVIETGDAQAYLACDGSHRRIESMPLLVR
jgi:hypothetical protein